jgi:uncharacterized protein YijF (DUF1287 family)
MDRRGFLTVSAATWLLSTRDARGMPSPGQRLAAAARAQLAITTGYDPNYTRIAYPNGDVPRSTGVCADVIVRAARDGLGLDLQKLVHEDMEKSFDSYPSRRVWGEKGPDSNIDHRRVLNLQVYFQRAGARIWSATVPTAGDGFPLRLEVGDIVTWLLDARLPHIGIIVGTPSSSDANNERARAVHNIGRGVEESGINEFSPRRAIGHYRWPRAA